MNRFRIRRYKDNIAHNGVPHALRPAVGEAHGAYLTRMATTEAMVQMYPDPVDRNNAAELMWSNS